ncbi:MAG TPA: NADH-quinone oxidoreductase subunit N [Trueperaceae bacterium]
MTFLLGLLGLVLGAAAALLLSTSFEARPRVPAAFCLGVSLLAFMFFALSYDSAGTLLGMIRLGGLSALGGMTLALIAALVILGVLADPDKYRAGPSEFYAFVLTTALGGILMIAANNLLLLYVGIELSSYSTYILVGYYRDHAHSTEAASKYFVLGALASALLLYGFSFIFGATGGIYYDEIRAALSAPAGAPALLWPGLALLLAGFGFKLALVPFHAWTPDAYQGAPTMVAALLSVGPKAGAVIALGSLLAQVAGSAVVAGVLQHALVWLAALTMTVGNLQALRQRNLKRLLGYSSVAQLGTIIVGLAAGSDQGLVAVIFYAVAYALTNIGAFTSLAVLRDAGLPEELTAYRGLGRRVPQAALAFTIFLLSLAGVPLLAGFAGKLFVFESAVGAGLLLLALVAVLNTVLAYAYYFRIIIAMWLAEPEGDETLLSVGPVGMTALALGALGVLLLGTFPAPTLQLITDALEPVRSVIASSPFR